MHKVELTSSLMEDFHKIVKKVFRKQYVYCDVEELFSASLFKLNTALSYYDPDKSALTTFMWNIVRNEVSKINSKAKRLSEAGAHEFLEFTPARASSMREFYLEGFVEEASLQGISLDYELLLKDLHASNLNPYLKVFLWKESQEGIQCIR